MNQSSDRWWIALVGFERRSEQTAFLPAHCQGAFGWMACLAASSDKIRDKIEGALHAVDLRLVEISKERQVESIDDVDEIDEHLASNMRALEPGKVTVWGTIHNYIGDGEA